MNAPSIPERGIPDAILKLDSPDCHGRGPPTAPNVEPNPFERRRPDPIVRTRLRVRLQDAKGYLVSGDGDV